ncbi:MAG: PepSY domain-containing protein [Microcoleaceae cyanobacterium]
MKIAYNKVVSINTLIELAQAMNRRLRQLHRQLAPILILPFLITAITGVAHRLSKSWLGLSKEQVHFLMVIHEGEYLGTDLKPFYVLLNGLGMLVILTTGGAMWFNSIRRASWFKQLQARFSFSQQSLEDE